VSEARGLSKEALRTGVADGRVVTGKQALEAKLVDKLGYLEDARSLAKELSKADDASVVKYRREAGFMELFGVASAGMSRAQEPIKVNLTAEMMPSLQPGMPYYLAPMVIPSR
jgi:protease-4